MYNPQDKVFVNNKAFIDNTKSPNWDKIKEDKQKDIMLGQCFNLIINKQMFFDLDNVEKSEDIKNQTKKLYKLLKELHEEI